MRISFWEIVEVVCVVGGGRGGIIMGYGLGGLWLGFKD